MIWQIDFACGGNLVKLIFAHEKLHGNNVWPDKSFIVKKLNGDYLWTKLMLLLKATREPFVAWQIGLLTKLDRSIILWPTWRIDFTRKQFHGDHVWPDELILLVNNFTGTICDWRIDFARKQFHGDHLWPDELILLVNNFTGTICDLTNWFCS